MVILAGYTSPMDRLLDVNPGLRSRIGLIVEVPNYQLDELLEILHKMASERGYEVHPDAVPVAREALDQARRQSDFGNARTVRQLLDRAVLQLALRTGELESPNADDVSLLFPADFADALPTSPEPLGYVWSPCRTR